MVSGFILIFSMKFSFMTSGRFSINQCSLCHNYWKPKCSSIHQRPNLKVLNLALFLMLHVSLDLHQYSHVSLNVHVVFLHSQGLHHLHFFKSDVFHEEAVKYFHLIGEFYWTFCLSAAFTPHSQNLSPSWYKNFLTAQLFLLVRCWSVGWDGFVLS